MNWYSLRVISGKEKSAEEHILREAGDFEITDQIEEVFVPYEKVIEMDGLFSCFILNSGTFIFG